MAGTGWGWLMASPNRTVNHWLHQSRCSSPARHRESRAVLLASSTLELHHQKAALCAPPGTPSGRTAISWPRALHPGGCPLCWGDLNRPTVDLYADARFMAVSFPLLACIVLVVQGSPTDRGECFEGRAGLDSSLLHTASSCGWLCVHRANSTCLSAPSQL